MKVTIDLDSLNEEIQHFNSWGGAARLYFNTEKGYFDTSTYINGGEMSGSFSTSEFVAVYSKDEFEGHISIGEKRKEYILKFVDMLLDGHEAHDIHYRLAHV